MKLLSYFFALSLSFNVLAVSKDILQAFPSEKELLSKVPDSKTFSKSLDDGSISGLWFIHNNSTEIRMVHSQDDGKKPKILGSFRLPDTSDLKEVNLDSVSYYQVKPLEKALALRVFQERSFGNTSEYVVLFKEVGGKFSQIFSTEVASTSFTKGKDGPEEDEKEYILMLSTHKVEEHFDIQKKEKGKDKKNIFLYRWKKDRYELVPGKGSADEETLEIVANPI